MASLPLGSVRGPEGLTNWEYVAFEEACSKRYRTGDEEQEAWENDMFEWHYQLSEFNERYGSACSSPDYYVQRDNNVATCTYLEPDSALCRDEEHDYYACHDDDCDQETQIWETEVNNPGLPNSEDQSFVFRPSEGHRQSSSSKDPFGHLRFPHPVRWAPGPLQEPNLVPLHTLINSSIHLAGSQDPR